MKVLVVGKGGREHALIWKLKQSQSVTKIYVAPGNDGMKEMAELVPVNENDFSELAAFVQKENIEYTVIGPEIPLDKGIVDYFQDKGLKIFGPTANASKIESSKIFAKNLMHKYKIPTADFFIANTYKEAKEYINSQPDRPMVVKADGLAAGKGVYMCENKQQANSAIEEMMQDEVFGAAGNRVIFEEMMTGEEASIFALSDGENYVILPSAQDHKRALDGDKGKNTGGMGAYSPAPIITDSILEKVEKEIIAPTIKAMKIEGVPFSGCLYAGLMLTESGPKVVEFNCRFGDPETQVVLPLIEDDLFNIIKEIADGQLKTTKVINKEESAICVVLASGGYPGKYENNMVISGLDDPDVNENYIIFHAGTKLEDGKFLTNGGRVLNVVTSAQNLKEAFDQVYNCVKKIKFDNMHYRTDIALRGLNK